MNPRHARVALAALGVAVPVDLVCLTAGLGPGHAVAEPLLMPLLAAHTARGLIHTTTCCSSPLKPPW
ncbi:hypothetical protein ACFYP4_32050 [Streptomyces sp. NPDC005551]|uniref:hypothetical protein n=1 Tax=unclassified Streptomyces TaxID=2593676 RepID=UPI0034102EDB